MRSAVWLVLILMVVNFSFAEKWSKNNVWKYQAWQLNHQNNLLDFENLIIYEDYFKSKTMQNTWLRTPDISLGTDYVVKDMFVNFSTDDTNDRVLVQLHSSQDDSVLEQRYLSSLGVVPLQNIFEKQVYMTMEFQSTNIKVWSFGLTRQPEIVVKKDEVVVLPGLLFYSEQKLNIDLRLRFPAYIDIIVFDKFGTVIDYIAHSEFYKEGAYQFNWDPETSSTDYLHSGIYLIYIRTLSTDGKVVETEKQFWLVHR